jgi:hypothetical protein
MTPGGRGTLGVPYFSDESIAKRCDELCELFDDIKGYYGRALPSVEISLDESRLFLAVTAYFHDVARHKWWHYRDTADPSLARINAGKKAALMCYWLNKIAPAYVVRTRPSDPDIDPLTGLPVDISLLLNAHYALHTASIYLGHRLTTPVLSALLYQRHWRDPSPKTNLLLFELFSMSIRGEPLTINEPL